MRPRRRKSVQVRETRSISQRANDNWNMDLVSDQVVGGQRHGGLICPRQGTEDEGFLPVGLASSTAMPARMESARTSQNRAGMV